MPSRHTVQVTEMKTGDLGPVPGRSVHVTAQELSEDGYPTGLTLTWWASPNDAERFPEFGDRYDIVATKLAKRAAKR